MKKTTISLVVAGLLLVGLRADAQLKPMEADLEKYKWKKRPLLLFSPSGSNPDYLRQKENIQADAPGLRERDMVVVVELVGPDKVYIDGALQRRRRSQTLRARFRVPPESFTVLLIGKDGTEKSRNTSPVGLDKIFGRIDQMPMRRQEMRSDTD
ncbi:DUF4174 domain-containing protein [Pontibacter russatus]|uniref:DUF4174 domain-containing protein n=1 Tax=Pontibacter russatus TaxID=2694929 RepID=UPI00137A5867|nr:DUF4174 domain-containing protein [Pontibacter russatus]